MATVWVGGRHGCPDQDDFSGKVRPVWSEFKKEREVMNWRQNRKKALLCTSAPKGGQKKGQ